MSLCFAGTAAASPWPMTQGEALVITRTENFNSREFQQVSTSFYAEYGLTEKLTFGTKAAYAMQEYGGAFPATAVGLTNAEVFARRQIIRKDHTVVSAQLAYSAPTRMDRQLQTPDVVFNPLRYGDAVELAVLTGHSLNQDGTLFVTFETAHRQSLGNDADLLRTDFLAGMKPGKNWLLLLKSLNTISLRNGNINGTDYDIYRLEPALTWHRNDRQSYTIGGTVDLDGRNLQQGTGIFFSLWNRF